MRVPLCPDKARAPLLGRVVEPQIQPGLASSSVRTDPLNKVSSASFHSGSVHVRWSANVADLDSLRSSLSISFSRIGGQDLTVCTCWI